AAAKPSTPSPRRAHRRERLIPHRDEILPRGQPRRVSAIDETQILTLPALDTLLSVIERPEEEDGKAVIVTELVASPGPQPKQRVARVAGFLEEFAPRSSLGFLTRFAVPAREHPQAGISQTRLLVTQLQQGGGSVEEHDTADGGARRASRDSRRRLRHF